MTTLDPYAAPAAPAVAAARSADVPQGAVEALRGTRPWVRLIAVLGFLGAALLCVMGLVVLLGGGASMFGDLGAGGGAAMMAIGGVYLLIGLLYFLPCLYLVRYAGRITRLLQGGGAATLVDALEQQRRFWRLVGIYAVAVLILYALIFVGAIVFAGIGAATGGFGGGPPATAGCNLRPSAGVHEPPPVPAPRSWCAARTSVFHVPQEKPMRTLFRLAAAVALAAALAPAAAAQPPAGAADDLGIDIPYQKFVLDNGLTLIVHEDRKAPIVAVNVWYHVGSKNQPT
ncbi:MAG TPA: hypothetical protein VHM02_15730, partial [Thermoanaerobaculia bacterium]|nr:hypothetical protein [Thermoanaerobaculia bacterium]